MGISNSKENIVDVMEQSSMFRLFPILSHYHGRYVVQKLGGMCMWFKTLEVYG